ARDDAGPHSDIDLGAVVDEPRRPSPTPTSRRRGVLVNVSWVTAEATRASFRNAAVAKSGRDAFGVMHQHGVAPAGDGGLVDARQRAVVDHAVVLAGEVARTAGGETLRA